MYVAEKKIILKEQEAESNLKKKRENTNRPIRFKNLVNSVTEESYLKIV